MKNNKVIQYLIPGALLTFYGLQDIDNFDIIYNGIALGLGILALVMAVVEFTKDKDQK